MAEVEQHIIAADVIETYFDRPYDYVVDVIGVMPTGQQKEVLMSIQNGNHFIAVRSGHGIGKTALEAWIIQWFIATRPNSRVPVTAPTNKQLLDVLWPEIRKWRDRSTIGHWFEWAHTRFSMREKEATWFAVARSSNKPDNMQGFHEGHILFVIEEASGVPENIMEVVEGALTTKDVYCIMFGNPTNISGTHFDAFHKDTKFYVTFTFSSEESPLVEKSYCDRMAAKFGKDSDVYRVRVLGLHPRQAADSIFSIQDVLEAQQRVVPISKSMEITIGVDVARFGDDKTVIAVKHGLRIWIEGKFYKQDTMVTCGKLSVLVKKYEKEGYRVIVNVDDTGVGGGVTDRLRELYAEKEFNAVINPVNNGERAFDSEHYANRGTEMWMALKEQIQDLKLPDDEDVEGELTTRKKKMTSKGQIILEKKEDMKRRGLVSPDTADAICLTVATTGGISVLEGGEGIIF